jgi:transposase
LPSVVRTAAPTGPAPVSREWRTRDRLSAISAISPAGQLYFPCQEHAINAEAVIAFRDQLRREGPGRMVGIWDGAPLHRCPLIKECFTRGAAQRLPLERPPAYAPRPNPGEGLWHQLKGGERRHAGGFNIPHLRPELRDAVTRVRRKRRILPGFFRGATL